MNPSPRATTLRDVSNNAGPRTLGHRNPCLRRILRRILHPEDHTRRGGLLASAEPLVLLPARSSGGDCQRQRRDELHIV